MGSVDTETRLYTLAEGCPYADPATAQRFSDGSPIKGLMLLQDTQLIETLAHFSRERIPERVVHARAVGAWGEFEVTHDISHLTSAKFLNGIGTKSKTLSRISTVGPERGSADTIRDVRGWALKIFTEQGNQDFVFNDIPVFFVRDPVKFPSLNRSHKRHPATNVTDATIFWDFHSQNQEGIHALMFLFSDRGTPRSVRHVNGYSGHAYKLVAPGGTGFHYVKFHFISDQGTDTMTADEATRLAGADPDYHTADLYNSIAASRFPSWTLKVQVMTPQQAEAYRWNVFDMTKVWPHADFPLQPVGKLTLNKNPDNYFADIEQAAFSPSTMVPGIAPSADPMLQARMFAYPDAARYRLGANYQQLPNNRPAAPVYSPYERDGRASINGNYGGDASYVRATATRAVAFASSGSKTAAAFTPGITAHDVWALGSVAEYTSDVVEDDFVQARAFWRDVLGPQPGQQAHFVSNVAGHIGLANREVWEATFDMFARVAPELGKAVRDAVLARDA
ncbi:catalase-like domain-containing protein [Lasiosphaeria miniovina]|uniref:Catalase-like domain-containing protein n=1 Tax=Lasiosphaeria miniovina TaxID=1954250 RepID=A0AA40ADM8_9PEZI|nr:catalase-like domain-containing protein [Lasiosphaeria miniovina]KAK0713920.1 catalase-like domain-containing protein [Lasiosphaeria miniovina]